MSDQNQAQKEPTPEEIKAYKEKMEKFYDEEIPFLEKKAKYEELQAIIDEARLRQFTSMLRLAQLQNVPEPKAQENLTPNKD